MVFSLRDFFPRLFEPPLPNRRGRCNAITECNFLLNLKRPLRQPAAKLTHNLQGPLRWRRGCPNRAKNFDDNKNGRAMRAPTLGCLPIVLIVGAAIGRPLFIMFRNYLQHKRNPSSEGFLFLCTPLLRQTSLRQYAIITIQNRKDKPYASRTILRKMPPHSGAQRGD